MIPGKELILGLFAQTVRKNAKSRSSPAEAVLYIARNVFQSTKKAARLIQTGIAGPKEEIFPGNTIPIKGKNTLKRKSHFSSGEKNTLKYPDKGCW